MIGQLKAWLRPARPVLLPVWRRLEPALDELAARVGHVQEDVRESLLDRRWASGRPAAPIRALRRRELRQLGREVPYYRGRAEYLGVASRAASDLIRRHGLTSALELGPHLQPLMVGADVMALWTPPGFPAERRVFVHDATERPWPFADRAYDLFVALQVFEHLGTNQPEVFREVRRIARHAIVSLPIDWTMDDPSNVHHRISEERVLSWFQPVTPTRILEGNGGRRRRIVYVFENLPPIGAGEPAAALPAASR